LAIARRDPTTCWRSTAKALPFQRSPSPQPSKDVKDLPHNV
jgi:hypothetical protein